MNQSKTYKLILIVLLLNITQLLVAQQRIYIPQPYGDDFINSPLISDISVIPLEIERYGDITEDMEIKADRENIFILDNKNTQCVNRYNYKGELLNTICENRPVQNDNNLPILSNPAHFNLDVFRDYVEIYKFENSTTYRFRYDGTLVDKIKFTVNPSDFARDKQGNYWISTGWNNTETQYRLLKTDANGTITDRKLRLITRCTPTESFAFYSTNKEICFWELLGNTLYLINGNTITPTYIFDFGEYNLPFDFHSIDGNDSFMMLTQKGYYTIKKYLENDHFAYVSLAFNSMDQRAMFHVIHDKKADKINIYTEDASIAAFDKAHHITENDELLFFVSPRKIRNLTRINADYLPEAINALSDEIGRTRTPVILKMKLRSLADSTYQTKSDSTNVPGY